jgi:hypothetical protein
MKNQKREEMYQNIYNTKSFEIKDYKSNKSEIVNYELTDHAKLRIKQRKINDLHLQHLIEYADCYFKQGKIFYVLGSKNLPSFIERKYHNTIMIVDGKSGQIKTCYRNDNPHKYIKKKSKRLSKSYLRTAA